MKYTKEQVKERVRKVFGGKEYLKFKINGHGYTANINAISPAQHSWNDAKYSFVNLKLSPEDYTGSWISNRFGIAKIEQEKVDELLLKAVGEVKEKIELRRKMKIKDTKEDWKKLSRHKDFFEEFNNLQLPGSYRANTSNSEEMFKKVDEIKTESDIDKMDKLPNFDTDVRSSFEQSYENGIYANINYNGNFQVSLDLSDINIKKLSDLEEVAEIFEKLANLKSRNK